MKREHLNWDLVKGGGGVILGWERGCYFKVGVSFRMRIS